MAGRLRTRKPHVKIEYEMDQKDSIDASATRTRRRKRNGEPAEEDVSSSTNLGMVENVVTPSSSQVVGKNSSKDKRAKSGTKVKAEVSPLVVDTGDASGDKESVEVTESLSITQSKIATVSRKVASKLKSVTVSEELKVDIKTAKTAKYEPLNWKTTLENIQKMRANKDAPVDSMGCERTMENDVDPKVKRFQTLLSLMLSSQTKDPVTFAAMERLKHGEPLTVQKMLDMPEEELGKTIIPVGFWRRKAQYIKKTCEILRNDYGDDIPNSIEGLCALPGVGPKMAYIAMNVAWEKNAGIGVDTHVHRISNRLKWTGIKETKTPEDTRKALESWLPQELWQEINILLVGFGQTICLPLRPKCENCLNLETCQFGQSELRNRKNRSPGKPKTPVKVSSDANTDMLTGSKYFGS